MLKTTLEVICDKCDASIVFPPEYFAPSGRRPAFQYDQFSGEYDADGGVVIPNLKRWLAEANWLLDFDWKPSIKCPSCKEAQ